MLTPLASSEWSYAKAAHLLNRAGFGGTPTEIAQLTELGPDKAVASLFEFTKSPGVPLPEFARPDPMRFAKMQVMRDAPEGPQKKEMRRELFQQQREMLLNFRHWWLEQMVASGAPLREKLVLFWHGHFATSAQKVKDSWLMIQQNAIFRYHAAGNWFALLAAVSKDPAMLIWLDQAQSRKDHPNENFAREVMELFTLGEGHYTEKDVTEAARAFTGWSLDRGTEQFTYRPFFHDGGTKTVLGRTGPLEGDDVLRIIISQPQAAEFITRKLWRFFANDNPVPELVRALAAIFRQQGNNFRPMLETMFRSREFYDNSVMRQQVKSPVQWLVGSVRLLDRELPKPQMAAQILRSLGQDLFLPPNVKGWDGGLAWITTNNLLARYNTAFFLIFGQNPLGGAEGKTRPHLKSGVIKATEIIPAEARDDKGKVLAHLEQRFIQGALKPAQERALRDFLENAGELDEPDFLHAIHLVMATPEYQLA
jgi:uncharacterized protein (DUF1800 family)